MEALHYIGWGFIAAGAFLLLTAALGIVRMPDFFTRLHPAGIADALGTPFVLVGVGFVDGGALFIGKMMVIAVFAMITSATGCHALAKSALLSGLKPIGTVQKKKRT
ncbi:MAG: monovalent cation/H(+) antiporter subunit G [Proteobacteria bacterium]|nr:monovalent cation/H(+) antiporter subunit G [Pseudomonadota bacterium]